MANQPLRVYVAGPYTGGNVNRNVRAALCVGTWILAAGHLPFVPHVCHFWDCMFPGDYETWMRWDLGWLEQCDVVLRLPGVSPGADREVARARELKKIVFEATDLNLPREFWWLMIPDTDDIDEASANLRHEAFFGLDGE